MEIKELYKVVEKTLEKVNEENGFKKISSADEEIRFKSEKGLYRLVFDEKSNILSFECSYEDKGNDTQFDTISKSLIELDRADEREAKSVSNEVLDEVQSLFASKKKVNLDKVKMPKAVSRTKAKNGVINYDVDSLANRFGVLYPEAKNDIKLNIANNGEFLPEDYFINHGNELVFNTMKNGSDADIKKLFRMLNEVYEDGTNEVQDVIGVTILGEIKGDKELMAVADKYMIKYMADPVHEINKITAKNNKYTKKLKNPPAYKPKKKKFNPMAGMLDQGQQR